MYQIMSKLPTKRDKPVVTLQELYTRIVLPELYHFMIDNTNNEGISI
jgi:hypothetical protein